MLKNVYAFVKEPVEFENLQDSTIFIAVSEAEKGNLKPLKDMYDTGYVFGGEHLVKGYYKLLGWKFNLSDYCKSYLVKHKHDSKWTEYKAPNKTCLYNIIGRSTVSEIIEK